MPKTSKAAFVRRLSRSLTAKQVVQKAKAAGIKLSTAYVYVLRSKAGGAVGKGAAPSLKSKGGNAEEQFATLALDLGIANAQAVLRRVRSSAMAVLAE